MKIRKLLQILALVFVAGAKCQASEETPKFKKSTMRVYRDWSAFIKQLALNLEFAGRNFQWQMLSLKN
ncbi:MAG: hypothetical protein HY879_09095 [Deltaproteobacteria bacterium]|nr:hypothetical protein [Deltaproteobacteria bacterium]